MASFRAQCRCDERGWVVFVAIAVMSLMLLMGLAVMKIVDTQAQTTGRERIEESALNLAEGVLNAEAVILQSNWPTRAPCSPVSKGCGFYPSGSNPLPPTGTGPDCNQANSAANTLQCPTPTQLQGAGANFDNVDANSPSTTWSVQVRDDIGGTATVNPAYVASTVNSTGNGCVDSANNAAPCTYDANNDKRMWIRAEATVKGIRRVVVGVFELQTFPLPLAHQVLVAGGVTVLNSGNKTMVNSGQGTSASQVVLYCHPTPTATLAASPLPLTSGAIPVGATVADVAGPNSAASQGFVAGQVIALGIGTTNYELVTISQVGTVADPQQLVFLTTPAVHNHAIGEMIALAPGQPGNTCMGWDPSKNQVQPPGNYVLVTNVPPYPTALPSDQLQQLISGPLDNLVPSGSCPTTDPSSWTGRVVIMKPPAGGCSLPGKTINATKPGFLVVVDPGTGPALNLGNNTVYNGVIYVANPNTTSAALVNMSGNPTINGGLLVDPPGAVTIGQAKGIQPSINYDPNAFLSFTSAGATGLVQNSWRELTPKDF